MSTPLPTVSVVVPCYRYGRFLPECVGSILDQKGVDVRVLIIDDASPDDSGDIAARLAAEDDRVEVRIHARNQGHIATYNEGLLEWADGDYSILLSADDLLTPGSIARATAVLEANPNVGFVYGHAVGWGDGEPRPVARLHPTGTTIWPGPQWLGIVCRLAHSVISSPEVVVRTSVQQKIGGYLIDLPHSGDAEMWMRFAAHSDVAYIKGVDQAYYRSHGTNMTTERVPIVDLGQRKAAYDAIFDSYPEQIPDGNRLRRLANRKLAKEALWEACRTYDRRPLDTTRVADLVEFAHRTFPEADRLSESWGLRWRERVGPQMCARLRPIMMSQAHRRVRSTLWWRRWQRQGV
jgi:glycosyltransferase involved in cell wall biosynthesis